MGNEEDHHQRTVSMRESKQDRDRMDRKVMDAIGVGCSKASEIRRFVFGRSDTTDSDMRKVDRSLQRLKRVGRVKFRWVGTKHGGRNQWAIC